MEKQLTLHVNFYFMVNISIMNVVVHSSYRRLITLKIKDGGSFYTELITLKPCCRARVDLNAGLRSRTIMAAGF